MLLTALNFCTQISRPVLVVVFVFVVFDVFVVVVVDIIREECV